MYENCENCSFLESEIQNLESNTKDLESELSSSKDAVEELTHDLSYAFERYTSMVTDNIILHKLLLDAHSDDDDAYIEQAIDSIDDMFESVREDISACFMSDTPNNIESIALDALEDLILQIFMECQKKKILDKFESCLQPQIVTAMRMRGNNRETIKYLVILNNMTESNVKKCAEKLEEESFNQYQIRLFLKNKTSINAVIKLLNHFPWMINQKQTLVSKNMRIDLNDVSSELLNAMLQYNAANTYNAIIDKNVLSEPRFKEQNKKFNMLKLQNKI